MAFQMFERVNKRKATEMLLEAKVTRCRSLSLSRSRTLKRTISMLNLDETMWRFYPSGRGTWAHRGADRVQLKIDGNEKAGFTAVGICDYDGPVLLQFLGKGKRKASVRQFGDVPPHVTAFSESGWTATRCTWTVRFVLMPTQCSRSSFTSFRRVSRTSGSHWTELCSAL
jgi:hypothetical protein